MMKEVRAAEMVSGDTIVLLVKVVNRNLQIRRCKPSETNGDAVVGIEKSQRIETIVEGESCKGMHVNEVRVKARRSKVTGEVLNNDVGRMVRNEGCYDKWSRVWIAS